MSIWDKCLERFHYALDSMRATPINAKIEQFKFDHEHHSIMVIYRLGRQNLLYKMDILYFEQNYFEKIPCYDQHLLTKFSTLQRILQTVFYNDLKDKNRFIDYIQKEITNGCLF